MSISTGITRTQMRAAPPMACPPRQAQSIAAALDISQVRQATSAVPMGNHEVIVVLASDYTG